MIHINEVYKLVKSVKSEIEDDYLAFEEDEIPGIQLTVACNDNMDDWSYQTGDNSFTGGAYGYPHWSVVGIYRNSNCMDIARTIVNELRELTAD